MGLAFWVTAAPAADAEVVRIAGRVVVVGMVLGVRYTVVAATVTVKLAKRVMFPESCMADG